jgi:hypothetical protein
MTMPHLFSTLAESDILYSYRVFHLLFQEKDNSFLVYITNCVVMRVAYVGCIWFVSEVRIEESRSALVRS